MNMLDYCALEGGSSFRELAFNQVDSMLFSELAYIHFDQILAKGAKMSIRELYRAWLQTSDIERVRYSGSLNDLSPLTLEAMAETRRFADCKVYNYRSILHPETIEQFAALMADLDDGTTVVAFRGTDDTLVGWKEDLMLSYRDIAAQEDAVRYVDSFCSIFKRYRIVGHSKGGNLALYSAMHCNPLIRMKIIEIISNDGPGLRPGSYDERRFDRLKKRYQLIVPSKDGVGTIYEIADRKTIVEVGSNNIVAAHNMLTWKIEKNGLMMADDASYQTDISRRVIVDFLKETTPKQREIFIKDIFLIMENAGISTLTQFSEGGMPLLLKTLKQMLQMDEEARKTASKLIKLIYFHINNELQSSISRKGADLIENIDSLIDEYKLKLKKKI